MANELAKGNIPVSNQGTKGKLESLNDNIKKVQAGLAKTKIPRSFYQLVIFVIDGSKSMRRNSINKISKAADIESQIKAIIARLKKSKDSSSFDIANIVFSDSFIDCFKITEVENIKENCVFNPVKLIENPGGTYLEEALLHSKELIYEYFNRNQGKLTKALILLMTDGMLDDYEDSLTIAREIVEMEGVTLSVSYLEDLVEDDSKWYSGNERTGEINYDDSWTVDEVRTEIASVREKLKSFASTIEHFSSSANPESVRSHMIKSISLVSKLKL